MFDKSPERKGYVISLDPDPPDDYDSDIKGMVIDENHFRLHVNSLPIIFISNQIFNMQLHTTSQFMSSSLLSGVQNLKLISGLSSTGLAFNESNFHGRDFTKKSLMSFSKNCISRIVADNCSLPSSSPVSQSRLIQHKKGTFWFYRFLLIMYDHVNHEYWTEDMKDDTLEPANIYDRNLIILDIGISTGVTTLEIVKQVDAKNGIILNLSPHQLADYISVENTKHWPDAQHNIREAYSALKIGGKSCLIGPVYPTFWLSHFFSDVWMFFPKEEEYIEWFDWSEKAGFKNVELKTTSPK